jgi:hypothetical protein
MNTTQHIASALALSVALVVPAAYAGNGAGAGDGTGPLHDLFAGTCEVISGTLAAAGYNGSGYVIDTGDGMVTIYGLGPASYWEDLGVALPDVGEDLAANVCWLTFSDGTDKAIATAVTLDGEEVLLRDPLDGRPLWRGPGAGQQR